MIFLICVGSLSLLEIGLVLIVRAQRRVFPWLITEADEHPVLSRDVIQRFFDHSHDPELGWVRRPDSEGVERGKQGDVHYRIDERGSRVLPVDYPARVAAFGDSYVFGRQVEDHETWAAQWSARKQVGVLNYGVGNYGIDQALLRYERTPLPASVQYVVLGFVPETICRIQSIWKHYLEFGNTLAFKPRFKLNAAGKLVYIENVMKTVGDFSSLDQYLPYIQGSDEFYKRKFRSVMFRFPYTWSFLRHPIRNACLMGAVAMRALCRRVGVSTPATESAPFSLLMRWNIKDAHQMYHDAGATALLSALVERFVKHAKRNGHTPLVLVMPQLLDLKLGGLNAPYVSFFRGLGEKFPVLDLTAPLLAVDYDRCYIDDHYGGHFSARGNQLVAQWLAAEIDSKQNENL